jgi:uncharacterized membrane protein
VVAGLLVGVGVASAAARAIFVNDLVQRMEPVRERMMAALGLPDPQPLARQAEMVRFDGNYARHPRLALGHVLPGALFLALAPLQFARGLRARRPRVHRWMGRGLLVVAFTSTACALYFGLTTPFGGAAEMVPITLFGALFLFSLGRAWAAIRARDVARHREWMIRAFAVAIGIATVRLVGLVLDLALTPLGVPVVTGFVVTLWIGWTLTLAAAEHWIRATRPRVGAMAAAA